MTLSGPGIPVRDRVLLHLAEFRNLGDAVEVPNGMSQAGIALALDVNRSQVTRALSELKAKDLIDERVTYVKGAARRCRTYNCTYPGEAYADRLKAMLLGTAAEFRDSAGETKVVPMGEVFENFRGTVPFSRFIIAVLEDRVLLDHGRADANARPMPVILGVEEAQPAGGTAADGEPGDARNGTGMAEEEPPETIIMDDAGATGPPPDIQDYRATYDSVLPNRFYEPARAPVAPWTDARDERAYQGQKPRTGQELPIIGIGLFLLSLVGLLVMVPLVSSGGFFSGGCICFFWIVVGLILSGVLLVSWSSKVEGTGLVRLPRRERLIVTGLLVVATVVTLVFLSVLPGTGRTGSTGPSDILAIFMIGLSLYGVVLARSGIPDHVRSELGVSAGWFMLLAPAGIQFFPGLVEYSVWMTGVWMSLGIGLVIMATDTGGLGPGSMFRAALPGMGGAAALLCALAMYDGRSAWASDPLGLAALAAWTGLGLFLVVLPFLRAELVKSMYGALGSVSLLAFGVGLVFLGLGLVRAGIYVGAVELALAAPAFYYGGKRFRESSGGDLRRRSGILGVVLLVVVVSLSRVLFIF